MSRSLSAMLALLDPWWSAFGDAALGTLVAAAQWNATDPLRATPSLEVRVAAAWASAKADGVVLCLIADAQAATRRQDGLLAARAPDTAVARDRDARAQRQVACAAAVRTIAPRRQAAVALLAGLCGMTEDAVAQKIARTADDQRMPRFSVAFPDGKPGTLDGFAGLRNQGGFGGAVRAALSEISAQREVEAVLSRCAVAAYETLQDIVVDVRAGTADEFVALEHYQQLILCSQQVATVGGTLALRWIGLLDLLGRQAGSNAAAPVHTAAWTSCGH